MSLGLRTGTVKVEPHSTVWEAVAQETIERLRAIAKDDIEDVQHIGSTSVRGICAKPIIDVAVGVKSFDRMTQHNGELAENGILYRREDHPGQLLYVCTDPERGVQTHYIHVVLFESEAWNNYLNLRDYLNAHEEEAKNYAALKERLAKAFPEDRVAYTNGKSEYIERVLRLAEAWRNRRS